MRLLSRGLTTVCLLGIPTARGRAVASGTREEAGIPRTRRASGEGGNKSEVRSLQVSPEGEGTRSSGAGTAQ